MTDVSNPDADSEATGPDPSNMVSGLERALGKRFVKDNHVQVVYRDGLYLTAKGPGFFWIRFWSDRTGPVVYIGPRVQSYTFSNLSTRDPVRVGLRVSAGFNFDPRRTDRATAAQFVSAAQDPVPLIVSTALLKSLRSQVSMYGLEQIRQGRVFEVIERTSKADLAANPLLPKLGIIPSGVTILEPLFSEKLEARFEEAAQRRFNLEATQDYQPTDLAETLAIEIVEKINAQGASEQYLTPSDIVNAVKQLPPRPAPRTRVIEGQVRPAPLPADNPSAAPGAGPPTSSPQTPSDQPLQPPPTYLDPDLQ